LNQTPEFKLKEQVDKNIDELETICHNFCEPSINPFFLDHIIPESSDHPCYDTYDDDLLLELSDVPVYDIYDDELFNPDKLLNFDLDTHTHAIEQIKPFCICICVEDELQFISNHVEKVNSLKIPFENVALDLAIFTFDEPLTKPYLDINVQSPEEEYDEGPIWDDEIKARSQFTEEEILEDELSVNSNHILKNSTLELHKLKKLWRIIITKI